MTGNKHRNAGLTLVEALIATAVIGVALVLTSNYVVLFSNSASDTGDLLVIDGEARKVLSQITEITREGYVDYDYYGSPPIALQQEQLAMRDLEGTQHVFWMYEDPSLSETDIFLCQALFTSPPCVAAGNPSSDPRWEQVNSSDVVFADARFYIRPSTRPYIGGPPFSDVAPLITITMEAQGEDVATELIQTSFTPRMYAR